jgi:hypothetical protein
MRPIDRTAFAPSFDGRVGILPSPGRCSDRNGSATGRALVVLTEPRDAALPLPRPVDRSRAAFLAQLIAVNQHLPQTRERRRAAPGEAVAAYGATMQMSAGRQRVACAREA